MYSKKIIFLVSCIGMLLFGITLITLGSVVNDLKIKLGLDEMAAGTLFSLLPLGVLTGSLLFGPFADKYGYRILMVLSCLFMSAGFEGIAFVESVNLLKLFVFIFGFGGGAINGATNALVSDISDTGKTSRLSLLGAFFGFGALGMPLLLGFMKNISSFNVILAVVGALTLAAGIFFLLIKYPPPKQQFGFPVAGSLKMLKDKVLIIIAFFLFLQSSFEGIMNNWTTTFLLNAISMSQSKALLGLSSFVAGMTAMRLLIGFFFKKIPEMKLLFYSFIMILAGMALLRISHNLSTGVAGLIITGAGLAAGFPVMLGITGNRYKELSGTAFSFVLFFGLIGNTAVNYLMGIISSRYGIRHLVTVGFTELFLMILLAFYLFGTINYKRPTLRT